MSAAEIRIRRHGVRKTYPDTPQSRARYNTELTLYQAIPWASPRIRYTGPLWLETERCTPILDLPKRETRQHRDRLHDLLAAVHSAGTEPSPHAAIDVWWGAQRRNSPLRVWGR